MSITNRISKKTLISASLVLVFTALIFNLVVNVFFPTEVGPKVSCFSFFLVQSDLHTKGVMSLKIDGKHHGNMTISATVKESPEKVKFHLARQVNFDYSYEGDGFLELNLINVDKQASDDMPSKLFNHSIFDFSVKNRRLRITTLGDGYLLWNGFSPVMMCVKID